ncbi:hypothetical protein KSF_109560 [Reticulibacter mediterranei]|uniref:Glycosyl hydrolase family 13 catalytic domain-containing protein n=1 Tax=Reticulibacter mediterranei TaxID=2778369 RepID=A0A8J3IUK7_9CHLR|nr:alpha-amylase family glycosyl hydrolase [Reticulibacter mediterranei]GHP00909.1 hypothetical protein KSF_109560 [Reticulibacter mediterranei]
MATFFIENQLGAWQIDGDEESGRVSFTLFFPAGVDPEIVSLRVAGDFQHILNGNDWDFAHGYALNPHAIPEGTIWQYTTPDALPKNYYQYKYYVEFPDGSFRKVSDPYCRYSGTENQNAALVVGGSRPADNVVNPLQGGRKPLQDLIIYEMNIDDFTSEYRLARAPLDAIVEKLDDLVALGFNAILFLPWTAWKNQDFDWGYEPFQYFAVEYRYTTDFTDLPNPALATEKISRLKNLISACHDRGIHVIMDGVYNHVSMDFPYPQFYRNPDNCPYTAKIFGGAFSGLQDLDFYNSCTQVFIRDVCLYWIDTFDIDGIRFDNSINYYVAGDLRGLPDLLADLQNYLGQQHIQNFTLMLEHLATNAPAVTDATAATSYWDNALYEQTFAALWSGNIAPQLLNALNNKRYLTAPGKLPTAYLSNHDHSHVSWQAGARENCGSMRWYRTQPYIIALYTSTAVPLTQNGTEFGEDHWIPEDDKATGRRVVPRSLQWKYFWDSIGINIRALYTHLASLRAQYEVLRTGAFTPDYLEEWQTQFNADGLGIDCTQQVMIYQRSGVDQHINKHMVFVVVLNFSDNDQHVHVPFPQNGRWTDLLSNYLGGAQWQPLIQNNQLDFTVGSHWGHLFFQVLQ